VTVRVKICGVTRLEDALAAVRLGADALGFNFWPGSRRFIAPGPAREIIRRLPPLVTSVGVFVDPSHEEAVAAAAISGVQVIQLHGGESPPFCRAFQLPVLKALPVGGPEALAAAEPWAGLAGLLLDAPSPSHGGSGRTCHWPTARALAERGPVILAGGLHPGNVAAAVAAVHPWGVDVASGVESSPGVKDHQLVARFIAAAKEPP
jgi:phosphoribosylanthranilate isomerase